MNFIRTLCALVVVSASGCAEPTSERPHLLGVELPVQAASTEGVLVFNTQLHPPDPCVDFAPGRDYGHVQLGLEPRVDGSWDATWNGAVAAEGFVAPLTGALRDVGGETLGSFSLVTVGGGLLSIVGTELFGNATATSMADAPEEYVIEILDAGGALVLEGNFGVHPPDPCAS